MPDFGSHTRRMSPVAGLRTNRTGGAGGHYEKLGFHLWSSHTCFLVPQTRLSKQTEIAQDSGQFPMTTQPYTLTHNEAHFGPSCSVGEHPTRMKAAAARGNVLFGGQSWLMLGTTSEWGKGSPCWHSWGQQVRSGPKLWLGMWDQHSVCPGLDWVPDLASPAPTLLPSRAELSVLGAIQSTPLERTSLDLNLKPSSLASWEVNPPPLGWCQALNIEETRAHMWLWL